MIRGDWHGFGLGWAGGIGLVWSGEALGLRRLRFGAYYLGHTALLRVVLAG